MWGAYSREFWAYPCFAVPPGTILHAADASDLAGMMDRLQRAMEDGFALPYAVTIDMAERLLRGRAAATLAIIQTGPNVFPIVVIPLIASALGSHHGPWAFLVLAAFVAAAPVANLRQMTPATVTRGL